MTAIRPSVDWQQDGAADGQAWKFDLASGLYVPFDPGAAGSGGHTIEDEGVALSARTNLNFVGAGVTASDDAVNDASVITIPGGGGSGGTSDNPETAKVELLSAQSIPNAIWTALSWDTEMWDTDGLVDLASQPTRITIAKTGKYRITASTVFAANVTGTRAIAIQVNGTTTYASLMIPAAGSGLVTVVECTVEVDLIAGDYITAIVNQSSGGALNAGAAADPRSFLSASSIGMNPTAGQTAKVERTASVQAVAANTVTAISWDNEVWDTDGMVDIATSPTRVTIKTAGKYRIAASVMCDANAAGDRNLWVAVNGTNIAQDNRMAVSASNRTIQGVTAEVDLAVGDYVEVYVNQNSGGSLNYGNVGDARMFMSVTSLSGAVKPLRFQRKYSTSGGSGQITSIVDTNRNPVDTALDCAVAASVGDWLEITPDFGCQPPLNGQCNFDAAIMNGSSVVRYVSGEKGVGGWQGNGYSSTLPDKITGTFHYQVQLGDIFSGQVTVRMVGYNAAGAGPTTVYGGATTPRTLAVRNIGQ